MAFQIDPSIPLQAQRTTFDPASILMQAQQNAANLEKHRFEMQRLREQYDAEKEARKQQKAMQMGIASDLAGIESGSPAQYAPPRFEQTPQRGQMPQGMTGVMMREQGQQMPQPQAFGEEILNGDFRLGGGEVTQEAVAGRQPLPIDFLKSALKQSMLNRDYDNALKFQKAIQESEKTTNEYYGGLTEGIDPKTGQPVLLAMTKTGAVPSGYAPKPKDAQAPKARVTWNVGKGRTEETWGYDAKGNEVLLGVKSLDAPQAPVVAKADPVNQAIEIEKGKEQVKQDNAIKAAQREKLTNANEGLPLLENYINALKESPQSGSSELYQKGMGFIGNPLMLGDANKQAAMAKAKQAGEALLTFAQKQPGPSTDRDVASYRAQMGVVTDTSLPAPARVAAAEQAKALLLKIQEKYGNYQDTQPSPTTINHGDTLSQLPATAPKGAVAKNAQTGKPEFIFNGSKWIPVGGSK